MPQIKILWIQLSEFTKNMESFTSDIYIHSFIRSFIHSFIHS